MDTVDQSAADFAGKVESAVHQGFVAVHISMGTRLGLFRGLANLAQSKETSVTSTELAASLNYKERYVREWLRGMACSSIIDHEEMEGVNRYWIAAHRLQTLVGDDNGVPAVFAELLTGMAVMVHNVEKCFPIDGPPGTEVDQYSGVHSFLAKQGGRWKNQSFVNAVINDQTLIEKLETGAKVLELGAGVAHPIKSLATMYPKSSFVASELSEKNLENAKANCRGMDNVSYKIIDACKVSDDLHGQFDFLLMFDVYHDVPYPDQLLDGVYKLLKPGGFFLMNEIQLHESVSDNKKIGIGASTMYACSTLYCMPTSVNHPGGAGLGACAGMERFERDLIAKGFSQVNKVAEDEGLFFMCVK